jgi:hypothetical protein
MALENTLAFCDTGNNYGCKKFYRVDALNSFLDKTSLFLCKLYRCTLVNILSHYFKTA